MTPAARQIFEEAAARCGVTVEAILGRRRFARLVVARSEIARRLYHELGYHLNKVARTMEHDHTSVLYWLGQAPHRRSVVRKKLPWHRPRVVHLFCQGCKRCVVATPLAIEEVFPEEKPEPIRRYRINGEGKVRYAGYDPSEGLQHRFWPKEGTDHAAT